MRLAEVTYDHSCGKPAWINSILCHNVSQSTPTLSSITLTIRGAKTANAGMAQSVLLNAQPNVMCPVEAVRRRLSRMASASDALFSFGKDPRALSSLISAPAFGSHMDI